MYFIDTFTALKRLKHLSLSGCRQLTNNCLPIIAGTVNCHCKNSSSGKYFMDTSTSPQLNFIEFGQLVSLNLENTGIMDAGVMEYAQTSPANLQHLNLSKTQVTHNILPSLQGNIWSCVIFSGNSNALL